MYKASTAERVEHLMVQLPTDVPTLRRIIKRLFQEADELQLAAPSMIYNLYVVKRTAPMKEKKLELSVLDGTAPIPALTKIQLQKYKGNFNRIFNERPDVEPLAKAIYKVLRELGYVNFTYLELMARVVKLLPPNIPRKADLKPFVYALLDDAKYYRTMSFNHKTKKPEVKFSLGHPLI